MGKITVELPHRGDWHCAGYITVQNPENGHKGHYDYDLAYGASDVQGEAPKYLLVQDRKGRWHTEGAIPDDQVSKHWLIKFPRGKTDRDRKVLKNECAYLEVARGLGLSVGEAANA